MATVRQVARVRADIDVMSRAGLPLSAFVAEATETLRQAVPFEAGCLVMLDPETAMLTGAYKLGALDGRNDHDIEWAQLEYGHDDATALATIVHDGRVSAGVHDTFGGDVQRSPRMARLLVPVFGFGDEARAVFVERGGAWGGITVFRGPDDRPFDPDELEVLACLADDFTRGIRVGLLAQRGDLADGDGDAAGPAVIIVDGADRLVARSPAAAGLLGRLAADPHREDPRSIVRALVVCARRLARGEAQRVPRVRLRADDGTWYVLRAAPLGGAGDRAGDVVVTMEEARPPEVAGLVADAFGLTAREREVVALVLRGLDTRQIAAALFLSPYTVQDHLKAVFDKAGVTSRRELVARIYFDQYAPRMMGELRGV